MGRHRSAQEKQALGEQARALRAAGRSRREIQRELHIGDDLAKELLRGVPLPDSLRRPRAKDELREAAVALRRQGATYDQICAELGVSKSSCSLWLRDLPHPPADPERVAQAVQCRAEALRARAKRDRDGRDDAGRRVAAAAAASLGKVSPRDLVLALAVSYWCEGAKTKPWNRQKVVKWMNSDPLLVTLFLEGLALLGIRRDRLSLRLHIHESADEVAARTWWSEHTGVPLDQFRRTTLKRHNPRTVRQNTGEHYRGCLCVTVLGSRELYDVLDGMVTGLARQPRRGGQWHDEREGSSHAAERGAAPFRLGVTRQHGILW